MTWRSLPLVAMLLLACRCGEPAPAAPKEPDPGGSPRRVVVLAPALAEMVDALGAADRVVGVGDFGPWPEALAGLPSVGGYDSPNVEQTLERRVDLLLTTASEAAVTAHRRLETLGVRVVALDTSTYDGVFEALDALGRLFGREERAAGIATRMRREIDAVREQARRLPTRSVLFVVGRDPLYVAGPGSHIDELIRLVGGRNVVHDATAPYQQVSLEAVLERRPEVIIDTSDNRPGALRGRRAGEWGRFAFLPAVRDDRVYWIDPGRLVIPGIRLPEMARLMARLVHAETFGEPADAETGW